jgi:hypothetical protein
MPISKHRHRPPQLDRERLAQVILWLPLHQLVRPNAHPRQPSGQQPFGQGQQRSNQQQQAPRGPSTSETKSESPAPQQPATPQPQTNVVNLPGPDKKENEKSSTPAATNGTNGAEASSPVSKTPVEPIIGLFVMNVTSDEAVRELFKDEDKEKILKIEKWGQSNKVAHFKTIEERDAVLQSLPEDVKSRTGEDRSRPLVKIFQPRENKTFGGNRGGAGNWGSSRGGNNSNTPQGGYRSGGASDSEGGRGGRGGRGGCTKRTWWRAWTRTWTRLQERFIAGAIERNPSTTDS